MNIIDFFELHTALIYYNISYVNIYNNIYLEQNELKKIMIEGFVKKTRINYNNFTFEYDFSTSNSIMLITKDLLGTHLLRLISLKLNGHIKKIEKIGFYQFNLDVLGDFFFELNNYLLLDNYLDFCTICGDALSTKNLNEINICSKIDCNCIKYCIPFDNSVSNLLKYDSQLFRILICLLALSISHPKAYQLNKSFPKIFNITNYQEFSDHIFVNMNIAVIQSTIDDVTLRDFSNCDSYNDIKLLNMYGEKLYSLVKIAILDNYFSLNSIYELENKTNFNLTRSITDDRNKNTIHMIKFNYPAHIENEFNTSYFLFHGAPIYSWYYIIKNGLKVMSGTNLQANGAVHGNGIYMSDDFNFSNRYCGDEAFKIIGIFELKNNKRQYYKTTNIFVIPTEKDILLRYIVVFNNNFTQGEEINKYFNTTKLLDKNKFSLISNIRLNKEYEMILQNRMILNIQIINQNTNWIIELLNEKYGQINIEIIFNNYPISPPTFRLLTRVNNLTTNIIKKNSIIEIQDLNPSKWTIKNNLSNLLDKINKYLL